jgi:hypothetical protein
MMMTGLKQECALFLLRFGVSLECAIKKGEETE